MTRRVRRSLVSLSLVVKLEHFEQAGRTTILDAASVNTEIGEYHRQVSPTTYNGQRI